MPSWKKVLVEGGSAHVNQITSSHTLVTGSLKVQQHSISATGGSHTSSLNFAKATNFKISLGVNTAISSSNESISEGQSGVVVLVQDNTGGRQVTLPSAWKTPRGADIAFDSGSDEINIISYYVIDSGSVAINYMGDFS